MSAGTPQNQRWSALQRPARVLVWLLVALAVLTIYREAEFLVVHVFNVLLLFAFAAILAMLLTPVVDLLTRVPLLRSRRGIAAILVWLVLIGLLVLAGILVAPSIVEQSKQLPQLVDKLHSTAKSIETALQQRGIDAHFDLPGGGGGGGGGVVGSAISVLTTTVTGIIDVVLVVVISIYLLVQGREVVAALRQVFPGHQHLFDFTLLAVGSTMAAYARGQFIMSVLIGLYTAVSMSLLGVHYAVLLGVVAALMEFLPLIGTPIAMALAVGVALFQSPSLALWVLLVGLAGHAFEAYIIGPRISGHVTQLHPLAAMAALLIGAELGGVLGALFAVPVAAVVNVFLGAVYRSRRGDEALTTDPEGAVHAEALPRLGEEIAVVDSETQLVDGPVPHVAGEGTAHEPQTGATDSNPDEPRASGRPDAGEVAASRSVR